MKKRYEIYFPVAVVGMMFLFMVFLGACSSSNNNDSPKDDPENTAPQTVSDSANIDEDGDSNEVSGNVLANDSDSDGPNDLSVANAGTYTLRYGSVSVNADGSYTYTLDNANPDVDNLNDGETLSDTFNYHASDGTDSTTDSLTITINGSTDAVAIDLTGVWKLTMQTTVGNCSFQPAGTDDIYLSAVQSATAPEGSDISLAANEAYVRIRTHEGVLLEGAVNTQSGALVNLSGGVQTDILDYRQPPATTAEMTITDSLTLNNAAFSNGAFSGSVQTDRQPEGCSFTQEITASEKIYQYTGSEDYSGMLGIERDETTLALPYTGGPLSSKREFFTVQVVHDGDNLDVHVYPFRSTADTNVEFNVTNIVYEPQNGYYEFTFEENLSYVSGNENTVLNFRGIFVRAPQHPRNDGEPVTVLYGSGYSLEYETDTIEPIDASVSAEDGYAFFLTQQAFTRTNLHAGPGGVETPPETQIRIGVNNPPLVAADAVNGMLHLQVLDPAGEEACTTPYKKSDLPRGGYWLQIHANNNPPPFDEFAVVRSNYARITCSIGATVDAGDYTVRIFDDAGGELFSEAYAPTVLNEGDRFNDTIKLAQINVNGASGPDTPADDVTLMHGFFDLTKRNTVSWTGLPETVRGYHLRLYGLEDPWEETRYTMNSSITQYTLGWNAFEDGGEFRVVATKRVGGLVGLSSSAKLRIRHGLYGIVSIDYGAVEPLQLTIVPGEAGPDCSTNIDGLTCMVNDPVGNRVTIGFDDSNMVFTQSGTFQVDLNFNESSATATTVSFVAQLHDRTATVGY